MGLETEMTDKHTPGPWTAIELRGGQHHIVGTAFDDSVAVTCYPFHGAPARAANARLIAAAPDLLAALRKVSTCLAAWMEIADPGDLREYDDEALGEALAAINQATGD